MPLPSEDQRAAYYRNRAEEIRTAADGMRTDEARRTLNAMADNYDELAARLERKGKQDESRSGKTGSGKNTA
jgi:hypothetical protein